MRISDWSSDVCSSDLRGLARFRAGNYGAALPDLDEAVRLLPASRDAVYLRGRVNDVLGKEGAALADFGRALVLAPGDGEAHVSRRLVRHERGDVAARSEELTSELQSPMRISYAVFCLQDKNPHLVNPNRR